MLAKWIIKNSDGNLWDYSVWCWHENVLSKLIVCCFCFASLVLNVATHGFVWFFSCSLHPSIFPSLPSSPLAQPCVSSSRSRPVQSIYCADANSHQHQLGKHGLAGPPGEAQHIGRTDGSGCVSLPVPPALVIYILPECICSWSGERIISGPLHSPRPHAALWILCSRWNLAARGCGASFWSKITAPTARKPVCSLRFLGEPGSDVPGAPACCRWRCPGSSPQDAGRRRPTGGRFSGPHVSQRRWWNGLRYVVSMNPGQIEKDSYLDFSLILEVVTGRVI